MDRSSVTSCLVTVATTGVRRGIVRLAIILSIFRRSHSAPREVPRGSPSLNRFLRSMTNPFKIRALAYGDGQSVQEWNKPTLKSLKTGGRNWPRGTNPPQTFKNPSKNAGASETRSKKEFFFACG